MDKGSAYACLLFVRGFKFLGHWQILFCFSCPHAVHFCALVFVECCAHSTAQ